jgi:hypothetical protein
VTLAFEKAELHTATPALKKADFATSEKKDTVKTWMTFGC